jgi:predicted TIM-barrel fold metal-dependent hydrolase
MSGEGIAATGIVDSLCNAIDPGRAAVWDELIAAQGVPVKRRQAAEDGFVTADAMLARMDELGIATLVIVAGDPHPHGGAFEFHRVTARFAEVEELARGHPGRFAALWCIEPGLGIAGVRRSAEVLRREWVVGQYLHVHSFDRRFDHADFYPFYALSAELGVPVVMQAGTSGGLAPSECGRPIGIDRPALYFRDTSFVLSHTGWPWVEEAIAMALKFPNVYLGTAAYPPRHWSPALVDFLRRPGRRKVLFGTNFPTVGHRQALAQLEELALPEEHRAAFLGENARSIFTRLARSSPPRPPSAAPG